jgi:hypothetical protein
LVLAATLVPISSVRADNPSNYALNGYVNTAQSVPVPSGVTVDLISGATHQVFSTTTNSYGKFSFTNSATGGALVPGSWGLWVPPQGNVTLHGCSPCGVLPADYAPMYVYETAQNLTSTSSLHSISGVTLERYNATIFGNATEGASPAVGANVELIAPGYSGFVLSNNTTRSVGNFSLKVPWGTWVLRTTLPGVPDQFDYQKVTVASSRMTVDPAISNYLSYGTVYQASSPTAQVPYGGNATVYDTGTGNVYSTAIAGGGFYAIGTYPQGFTGTNPETFDVVLSTIGYGTVWYPLTVSGANTTGIIPHNLWAPAEYAPASYNTTLTYSTGFKWLNTSTNAWLGNDSVIPELPNASVGQLWAQLALDWQHNVTFDSANLPAVEQWINSSGPFFPAGAAQAKVNSSGYNESAGGAFSASGGCTTGWCGLGSNPGALQYSWAKSYSVNGTPATNAKSYSVSFNFRHPTNFESINYTLVLPTGYVLQAGTSAPSGSRLVAGGVGGTWNKFTLVSQPWSSPSGSASFTFVKTGNVTANVNATVGQFAFSKKNVLNATHGNYTVIVGAGQNVTFSAAGSTFPNGINGSKFEWVWGDSQNSTTTQPIAYHTYAAAGDFDGSLNLTSSGGTSATVAFHVYVGSGAPTGSIVSNASAAQKKNASGTPYLWVNWSTSLQFNATGFTSALGFTGAPAGIISVASWNATDGPRNVTSNLTAGSGADPMDNFTVTFDAAGDPQYLATATVGADSIPLLGWQYNITAKIWDGNGNGITQKLIVLVHDTQKPISVSTVQDSSGRNVTSSGVVEAPNHTASVKLVGSYASDPNGGSLTWYNWSITNSGNSSVHTNVSQPSRTGFRAPLAQLIWLNPQSKPYSVNLTVTDRAGNKMYNVASLTVAVNTSTRPVLAVGNLTADSTMTDGTSYTVWVNVTNTLGANSTALNVSVNFYLLPPSGSGNPISIGGAPGSVQFFAYNNATGLPYSNVSSTGTTALKYNQTVRAQISFNPARTGSWELWVNATASNEFAGDYATGGNQAHVSVTLNQNPIILDLEIVAVIAVVVAIIVGIILYTRWNRTRGSKGGSGKSGGSSSAPKKEKSDKDLDDDDED